MDLIKIGKYLAGKRKALGLTQRQLAEQLGMSDKSVSKWERGVCLPDVSLYTELCRILGISINEFLAGEDIAQENLVQKSEENIIGVATDSKQKQRRLLSFLWLPLVVSIIALAVVGVLLYRAHEPQNYIAPVDRESAEMKTVELLSGADGAYLYQYATTEDYSSLKLFVSEYHAGKLIQKDPIVLGYDGMHSPKHGTILIVPDFDRFTVRVIIADDEAKFSTELPILDGVEDRVHYGRSAREITERTDIIYGEEQPLAALIYDNDEMSGLALQDFVNGTTDSLAKNDYVYYFSFEFCS